MKRNCIGQQKPITPDLNVQNPFESVTVPSGHKLHNFLWTDHCLSNLVKLFLVIRTKSNHPEECNLLERPQESMEGQLSHLQGLLCASEVPHRTRQKAPGDVWGEVFCLPLSKEGAEREVHEAFPCWFQQENLWWVLPLLPAPGFSLSLTEVSLFYSQPSITTSLGMATDRGFSKSICIK